jgi:hypothetical protein
MTITLNGTAGVTFPAGGLGNPAGAVVGTTDTQTLTNKTLGSGLVAGASYLTSGTVVASTSGTSIDFTSIPSWVKRITVMFSGVSTSGTSNYQVQIGASSFTTSGYLGASTDGPVLTATLFTTGFGMRTTSAAAVVHGALVISTVTGNTWVAAGTFARSDGAAFISTAGSLALGGTLDRVRITTVNGTDTFDAGSINILYE